MPSIRRYLLATLLAVAATSMLVTGWLSWRDAAHEVEELFDAQLAQSARMLVATLSNHPLLISADDGDTVVFPAWHGTDEAGGARAAGHKYETRLMFQLWEGRGERLLMRSSNASAQPLAAFTPGYERVRVDGERFHVFTLAEGDLWLQVAQDDYMRRELAGEIALAAFLPHAAGIPFMGLLIWWLVARGLRPLDRLREALAGRGAARLDAIDLPRLPRELGPVVAEVNGLLARLADSFARERRFTADAAHELRTPLAVLRIQAENALAATDDDTRRQALAGLLRGVDRASRLVGQMLVLARLEPSALRRDFTELRLQALVREELAELVPMASARGQEIDFIAEDDVRVQADRVLFGVLVANLVDNALRYSPDGATVRVVLRAVGDDRAELSVFDEGPGVPPALVDRVFDPFFRGETGRGDGAGLGLAIVRRIAAMHGGEVRVRARQPGVDGGFTVTLPRL